MSFFDKTKSLKVLYVEDYPEARESTLILLREFFDDIIVAKNGKDGLEKFKNNNIDLIITDINMPIMDGIEMAKHIREIDKEVPIIFISAYKDLDYLQGAIKVGADDFIFKPFDIDEITKVFEKVVDKIESKKQQYSNIYNEIVTINANLKDAMDYALLIQKSLNSDEKELKKFFKDSFAIWEPKEIVGGDIWIFEQINDNEALLFVIDGVGHGISGGFIASAIKAIENDVVNYFLNKDITNTAAIIKEMYKRINFINKKIKDKTLYLNFDGAVFYFNKEGRYFNYTNSNIYTCVKKENSLEDLVRLKLKHKMRQEFYTYRFDYQEGNILYVTTDGYLDEINSNGEIYGKKRFKEFVLSISSFDLNKQRELFIENIKLWLKDAPQTDDITLVGIKF